MDHCETKERFNAKAIQSVVKRFKKSCASIKRITFGHYSRLYIYIKLSCTKIIMQIRPFGQAQPLGQV